MAQSTRIAQFRVKVVGVPALASKFKRAKNAVKQAVRATLFQEAEKIMTASKRQVPVDTGNLRASGHVTLPFEVGGKMFVELGYGGPAGAGNHGGQTNNESVGYALSVHEDLQARHNPGQKAKYLEDPVNEHVPKLSRAIDAAVHRAARTR